ncbi:hypothetical protein BGZ83_000433 [Gryganskiella cystojenkinii]|nr:hypothetical protein BGZ83_000433 [Gryganskiella cystojenkinii]
MRPFGWKRLYQAMDRVEVYTWGSNEDCRLGYGRSPKKFYESVPKRVRRLDGVGIVQLAPSGWGCHALDRHGNVWAWGRIMASNAIKPDAMPRMLTNPRNVVDLTAGRQVVLAKDSKGQVWQWCRENAIAEVTFGIESQSSSGLQESPPQEQQQQQPLQEELGQQHPSRPRLLLLNLEQDPVDQISAGWDICAALTRSGRIYAWRPLASADDRYKRRTHVQYSVSLKEQGSEGYESHVMYGDKFVKIAAGSDYVIAVTALEKVYIFRRLDSPHYIDPTLEEGGAGAQRRTGRHHHHHHNHNHGRNHYHDHPHPHHEHHHNQRRHLRGDDLVDKIVMEPATEGSIHERVLELRGRILGHGLYLPIFSEALTQSVTETYEEHDQRERQQRHHLRRRQSMPPLPRQQHPHYQQVHAHLSLAVQPRHQHLRHLLRSRDKSTSESSNYGTDEEEEELDRGGSDDVQRDHTLQHGRSAVPLVSSLHHRASLPAMTTTTSNPRPSTSCLSSSSSRPTTVSANYRNFALHHSSGKVLLGMDDVQVQSCPIMVDRLLAHACQVEFGDYHQGLLTEDGQLRTWGAFADGALGHGDLRTGCAIPTVVEGLLKNKFVIKIGLAGWQSACLAIDLSEERAPSEERLWDLQLHRNVESSGPLKNGLRVTEKDDGYHSLEMASTSGSGSSGSSGGDGSSGSTSEGFDSSSSGSDGEDSWVVYGLHRGVVAPVSAEPTPSSATTTTLLSPSATPIAPVLRPLTSGLTPVALSPPVISEPSLAIPILSSSLPTTSSASPWLHHPALTHFQPLTSACSATCSLVVSPHSHRLNSSGHAAGGGGSGAGSSSGSHGRNLPATPIRKRSLSVVEKFSNNNSGSRSSDTSAGSDRGPPSPSSFFHEEKASRMLAVTRLNPTLTVYEPADSTTRHLANLQV